MTKMRKKCNDCKKDMATTNFYSSNSIMFSDGLVPICKRCIKTVTDPNDIESVKTTLRKIDKPFIAKVWKSAEETGGDVFGIYIKNINSLPQYKNCTWDDSNFSGEENTELYQNKFNNIENIEELETEDGVITLSKDIVLKFGSGFTNYEYLQMEKLYKDIERTNAGNFDLPQLKQQVVNMCKLQIKMDRALEHDDATNFKKYSDTFQAILASSGLAPKDKKNLSDATGIRSFSSIFEEVEKHGYVEPKPITERMDLVDVALLEHLNYVRLLHGVGKLEKVQDDIREKLEEANGKLLEVHTDN